MEEEIKDRWLTCLDCHNEFIFKIGEQKYYHEKGFEPPKRCPSCRPAARARFSLENGGQK